MGKKKHTDYTKILIEEFGLFLSASDLARLFKYASGEAVRKAAKDGRLPVRLRRFADRRGLYVPVHEVAVVVERMSENET